MKLVIGLGKWTIFLNVHFVIQQIDKEVRKLIRDMRTVPFEIEVVANDDRITVTRWLRLLGVRAAGLAQSDAAASTGSGRLRFAAHVLRFVQHHLRLAEDALVESDEAQEISSRKPALGGALPPEIGTTASAHALAHAAIAGRGQSGLALCNRSCQSPAPIPNEHLLAVTFEETRSVDNSWMDNTLARRQDGSSSTELLGMNDKVKIALVIALAAVVCVCLYIYFSPFQTCLREGNTALLCGKFLSGLRD